MAQTQCLGCFGGRQGCFLVDTDDGAEGIFGMVVKNLGKAMVGRPEVNRRGSAVGELFEHRALVAANRDVHAQTVGGVEEIGNAVGCGRYQ